METQDTIIKERFKVIFNDDVAILDYLADMTDRAVVRQLQAFINYGNHEPNAILHRDIRGHHTLLLYKAPFGINKGNNNLTLYSFGSLPDMSLYFKRWRDNTNPFNKLLVKCLTEITEILYFHRLHEDEDSTPAGYRS